MKQVRLTQQQVEILFRALQREQRATSDAIIRARKDGRLASGTRQHRERVGKDKLDRIEEIKAELGVGKYEA